MNIILFGPPGAGKGTQANNLVKDYNLHNVSTGDLLRNEIRKDTVLGNKIKTLIDKGMLVSDDIVKDLLKKVLSNKEINNKLIFDGYPRNLEQAKELDSIVKNNNQKISCVLSLHANKEIIVKRILGREICSKCGLIFNKFFNPANKDNHHCDSKFLQIRSDDNEKTVVSRYQTYLEKTLPILNFYRDKKLLYEVNGIGEINDIYKEIRGIITSIET